MFAINAINAAVGTGFAGTADVRVGAASLYHPLPLHLLPYPGSGPAGLALIKETGI